MVSIDRQRNVRDARSPAALGQRGGAWRSWLDRPLSGWWCVFGWLAATVVFTGLVRLVGGPSEGDLGESAYTTWAMAHGQIACAYSPGTTFDFPSIAHPGPFIAPLWTMLSGAAAALFSIGHSASFPSQSALGPHCSTALVAMYKWSVHSSAAASTVRLGYLGWLALMAGLIALLRASGRGRCGWEPLTLVLVACIPVVWMPLVEYFHPQDLVAMGLILGGLACARKGAWAWAGVLLALAVTSQQFAILALAPLAVVAPSARRARFLGAATAMAVLVIFPLMLLTRGRVMGAVLLGSGNYKAPGGTVLWEMHFHGPMLIAVSRILPVLLSVLLARWSMRRLGPIAREPIPLVSLVATSLSLRLVFEQNLFGYYFVALAVALITQDVLSGRLRGQLVAWLALLVLVYDPVPWGFASNSVTWGLQEREFIPFLFMAIAFVLVVHDAIHGRIRGYLVAWLILVALAFGRLPWSSEPFRQPLPTWFWQGILVAAGVALAVRPLLSLTRSRPSVSETGVTAEVFRTGAGDHRTVLEPVLRNRATTANGAGSTRVATPGPR
jgi:hypothetical protein